MAGRYSRVDGTKSTSYCSAVTIAVFVAFCLVGVWMFMSSSAAPFQNSNVTTTETKVEDQQIVNVPQKETKQFEDIPGDLPEDATKGNENVTQNETDNSEESSQEDTNVKQPSLKTKKIIEVVAKRSKTVHHHGGELSIHHGEPKIHHHYDELSVHHSSPWW